MFACALTSPYKHVSIPCDATHPAELSQCFTVPALTEAFQHSLAFCGHLLVQVETLVLHLHACATPCAEGVNKVVGHGDKLVVLFGQRGFSKVHTGEGAGVVSNRRKQCVKEGILVGVQQAFDSSRARETARPTPIVFGHHCKPRVTTRSFPSRG